jgi:KaiC
LADPDRALSSVSPSGGYPAFAGFCRQGFEGAARHGGQPRLRRFRRAAADRRAGWTACSPAACTRGRPVLASGAPGTGKTSLGAHLIDAACARRERALLVLFEGSPEEVIRNMRSVGLDLGRWVEAGLMRISAARQSAFGLESHLTLLARLIDEQKPTVGVLDGIASLAQHQRGPDGRYSHA